MVRGSIMKNKRVAEIFAVMEAELNITWQRLSAAHMRIGEVEAHIVL